VSSFLFQKLKFIFRWFFPNISYRDAERLLLENDYPRGTFLVRKSEQRNGNLIGNLLLMH